MLLSSLLPVLDSLAPLSFASSWDNVGLLAGDPGASITKVLVTVDYTRAVAEDTSSGFEADLVVAYHPPIFSAWKRIPHDAVWAQAIRRGVALYSMHTALDVAEGGTNDVLADAAGIFVKGRRALRPLEREDAIYKVVTFVPREAVEGVSEALFEAGAGKIGGAYSKCSFRAEGIGTFFGEAGANPAVGERGRLERVEEVRLETVFPRSKMNGIVDALRRSHPYEEPAFDLFALANASPSALGLGRVGEVDPTSLDELMGRVKATLGLSYVLVARAGTGTGTVRRVAVAAGSGGDLVKDALRAGADVLVTGEVRHHDALAAVARGMSVVATLHSNSERLALRRFAERLAERATGVRVEVSSVDVDPFRIV